MDAEFALGSVMDDCALLLPGFTASQLTKCFLWGKREQTSPGEQGDVTDDSSCGLH